MENQAFIVSTRRGLAFMLVPKIAAGALSAGVLAVFQLGAPFQSALATSVGVGGAVALVMGLVLRRTLQQLKNISGEHPEPRRLSALGLAWGILYRLPVGPFVAVVLAKFFLHAPGLQPLWYGLTTFGLGTALTGIYSSVWHWQLMRNVPNSAEQALAWDLRSTDPHTPEQPPNPPNNH